MPFESCSICHQHQHLDLICHTGGARTNNFLLLVMLLDFQQRANDCGKDYTIPDDLDRESIVDRTFTASKRKPEMNWSSKGIHVASLGSISGLSYVKTHKKQYFLVVMVAIECA